MSANISPEAVATEDKIAVKFTSIPLEGLRLNTVTNFNIYISTADEKEPVLYRGEALPFTERARTRLVANDIEYVYILRKDKDKYQQYVEENLDKIVADDEIEPVKKADIVYTSASYLMERLFEDVGLGENVRRGQELVTNTVGFILRDERAFRSLLSVTSYDYYTYTHSVNVCVFSVALARRIGITDDAALQVLGTGALLHDVGKSIIDKSIIGKKGPLDEDEWKEIKKHPVYGVELLRDTAQIPEEGYTVVRQHHERCDGSGYPEGRDKVQTHPYAKVGAIADVFDALTTKRSYKGAVGSFAALNIMKTEMQAGLDRNMFREFVTMMAV